MKKILLIIARSINGMIGRDNDLPWGLHKDDMNFFMSITMGGVLIMGRLTAESLLKKTKKALSGRINIVISRKSQQELQHLISAGFIVCSSYEEAMREAHKTDKERIWIIGGAQLYALAAEHSEFIIDEMYITEIQGEFEGDTECPNLYLSEYERAPFAHFYKSKRNPSGFDIDHYVRLRA